MLLLRGWTLLPANDNCLENYFDSFHLLNKERIKYLRNFLFSKGEVQKVFWNTTLFCRQWLRLLSAWTFKSFFQKQQSVGNTNVFLWTSSQKLVANMISVGKKEAADCDRRVKHFPFLQKQTMLETKKLNVTSTSKTVWKNFLKHESLSVSQKASSLRTTFTLASITTSA